MPYTLAIDAGTTGITCVLYDASARPVRKAYAEIAQHYPRPGWVEHDAVEIRDGAFRLVREALSGTPIEEVAAIGVTNQRETTVLWDRRTGEPVHRAIVWQCRRTAEICARLKSEGREPLFRERTGLVLDAYFSGPKVTWLLENVPGLRARAERGEILFGTIDTWLLWNLTGGAVHATDPTNASRTLLFDIRRRAWDPELCGILGVPPAILPEVRPSAGDFGMTRAGLLDGVVAVRGIAGDQQSALYGQGATSPGEAKNTYGTGCFLLLHTGAQASTSRHGLLTTCACDAAGGPAYALEGAVFIAGAAVQWLRDGLGVINTAAESEGLAASVRDTGGAYLVPAFVGLGAPYWDMDARGALVGITRGTRRAHVVRAALESIAYQTRDLCEAMASDAGRPLARLRVDGGAVANDFLMQFQSDVLATDVIRPRNIEVTSLGAAILAGVGAGLWKDRASVPTATEVDRVFRPAMAAETRERLYRGWREAVARVRSGRPA